MHHSPETRASLILRLADQHDDEAWREFVQIYEPLIFRLARQRGLQDADATEVTQETLWAVAKAVDRWQPNHEEKSFRRWLFRIARNLMINYLTRGERHAVGSGDTDWQTLLEQQPGSSSNSAVFDLEYRRQLFRWAAERVRPKFQEKTWQAFWLSTVEGRSVPDVAAELEIPPGSVYVARSRVMCRLREAIQRLEEENL